MSGLKRPPVKRVTRKAPVKRVTRKAPVKRTVAKKAPAKRTVKKSTPKKVTPKKTAVRKRGGIRTPTRKMTVRRRPGLRRNPAKKKISAYVIAVMENGIVKGYYTGTAFDTEITKAAVYRKRDIALAIEKAVNKQIPANYKARAILTPCEKLMGN